MTIVRGSWPPTPVAQPRIKNGEPAVAEIMRVSSHAIHSLAGHAVGGDEVKAGEANTAPRNPSGDFGHDHSGGWYGRQLYRTVATMNIGVTLASLTDLTPSSSIARMIHDSAADGVTTSMRVGAAIPVWVPPCDPLVGAYVLLGVSAKVAVVATGLVAGDGINVSITNRTPDADGAAQVAQRATIAMDLIVGTGVDTVESTSDATRLMLTPGRMNLVGLRSEVTRGGTGGNRGCTLDVLELELGVYEAPDPATD